MTLIQMRIMEISIVVLLGIFIGYCMGRIHQLEISIYKERSTK